MGFFEGMNKIYKPLVKKSTNKHQEEKREKPNKIINERGEITTNSTEISFLKEKILWTVICQQTGQIRRNE